MIVGITGRAGSGKDTVADFLVERHGFIKLAFANPMKALLNERFGWPLELWGDREWKERPSQQCGFHYCSAADFSPRSWAQWLGTEVGRHIDQDAWVKLLFRDVGRLLIENPDARIVISDVRFDNEAQAIVKAGGQVIELYRDTAAPVAAHVSENGVSSEFVKTKIPNSGTIDELHQMIACMALR